MDDKPETMEAVLKESVDLVLKQSYPSLFFVFVSEFGFKKCFCFLGFLFSADFELLIAGKRTN